MSSRLTAFLPALLLTSWAAVPAFAKTPTAAPTAPAAAVAPVAPGDVVDWATPDGVARLERSRHKQDFFALAPQFESQTTRAFCGPTSSAIVLNALRNGKDAPDKTTDPSLLHPGDSDYLRPGFDLLYKRYTQGNFFNARTDQVKTRAEVLGKPRGGKRGGGIELRQLHEMLLRHGLTSELHVVADDMPAAAVKADLVRALSTPGTYVLVNFKRAALGQKGGGHISPLGAYDDQSDSFLLMDVNPNDHPWVWVKTAALVKAMRTKDAAENRGFLVLRERG